jgi:hypothetical protein
MITRRRLQVILGCIWFLDGLLQLQPYMFTRGFALNVIAPAANGQPAFVADGVRFAASMIGHHPAATDLLFAGVQLALGAGLLTRKYSKLAIVASLGWALGIWYFGEGLGGLASGGANFLSGAPGAALLYGILAIAAWPKSSPDGTDETPPKWIVPAWVSLWLSFAVLGLLPANRSSSGLITPISTSISTVPSVLGSMDHAVATGFRTLGGLAVPLFLLVIVAIAVCALKPGPLRNASISVASLFALVAWAFGQSFGQLLSGQATDPSTSPLLIVMGLVVVSATSDAPVQLGVLKSTSFVSTIPAVRPGASSYSQ